MSRATKNFTPLRHPQRREERIRLLERQAREIAQRNARLDRALLQRAGLERRKAQQAERLALYRGATPEAFSWKDWERIQDRYENRCAYCLEYTECMTMDHIIPVSKGGKHHKSNIIPACKSCNSRKGNRPASRYDPLILPW